MVGVTYDPVYADKDLGILLDHLVEDGDSLCIDGDSLALLCYCGTCPDGVREFRGKDRNYSGSLETGVFLYGTMPWTDDIRRDTSMLIVKTGMGTESSILESIDDFEQKAAAAGVDVRIIDYSQGNKYFDVTENPHKPWEYGNNVAFTADCDVMKDILAFLQEKLLKKADADI